MIASEATAITRMAVHNIAGGITGSDERVKSIAAQIKERQPSSLFMPEAYSLTVPHAQPRVENFASEMATAGYVVGYTVYDGKAGGCMALVRKSIAEQCDQQLEFEQEVVEGDWQYFKLLWLAGRGAIEMSLRDLRSERKITEVGMHANTLQEERGEEISAFIEQYAGVIAAGEPLVLAGDLNTTGKKNVKTCFYQGIGKSTEVVYNALAAATGHRLPAPDYRSSFPPARLASIPIRVGQYAESKEYNQLVNAGYTDISPEGPTTSFPGMQASNLVLRLSGVQSDHIMCAPMNQFVVAQQTRYPQGKGDDHNWVEAGVYLHS